MKVRITIMLFIIVFGLQNIFARSNVEESRQTSAGRAKYVFLFIGDGMSLANVNAAEVFLTARNSSDIKFTHLEFSKFPVIGLNTTYDAETFVTDSASAGTAIATGNKTLSSVLGMDTTRTRAFKSIAEYAKDAGMKVGIVSSVTLNHATPASFYANVPHRNDLYDIAIQLADSNFDYFGGGGIAQNRGLNNDQPDALERAKSQGYTYVDTKAGFNALRPGVGKVIAVNEVLVGGSMPYEIDRKEGDLSLADFTRKGIELLYNPNGFFFMIEGGKIDWVGHSNDPGALIHDVLALEAAVKEAIEFARRYPNDTLIVVTGDHDTGGMSLGYSGTRYALHFDKIALQRRSFEDFNTEVLTPYKRDTPKENAKLTDLLPEVKASFGIDFDSLSAYQKEQLQIAFEHSMGIDVNRGVVLDRSILYDAYEPFMIKLSHILSQISGIGWTSFHHTGIAIPLFARGAGAELFSGYYDNTDIFRKLAQAMNLRVSQ